MKAHPAWSYAPYRPPFFETGDLYLCRTAMNGAHSYHDSNYATFHRIRNFRNRLAELPQDSGIL